MLQIDLGVDGALNDSSGRESAVFFVKSFLDVILGEIEMRKMLKKAIVFGSAALCVAVMGSQSASAGLFDFLRYDHHEAAAKPSCAKPAPKPSCCKPTPKPSCCKPAPKPSCAKPHPKPSCAKPAPKPSCAKPHHHAKPAPTCCKPAPTCCKPKPSCAKPHHAPKAEEAPPAPKAKAAAAA